MEGQCPDGTPHHWVIETCPRQEDRGLHILHGRCKKCLKEAVFPSFSDETYNPLEETRIPVPKARREAQMPKKDEKKRKGWNFSSAEQRKLAKQKHLEYESRKDELINIYLDNDESWYKGSKAAGIPHTSFKQLIERWRKKGYVERIRAQRKKVAKTEDLKYTTPFLRGKIASIIADTERISLEIVLVGESLYPQDVHLGSVELRYIS